MHMTQTDAMSRQEIFLHHHHHHHHHLRHAIVAEHKQVL